MKLLSCVVLVVSVVFFLVAKQTQGQEPSPDKGITGNQYAAEVFSTPQEETISPDSDKQSLLAHEYIEAIENEAEKLKSLDEDCKAALNISINSLKFSVKFVADYERRANDAIAIASNQSQAQDKAAAIQTITTKLSNNRDLVFSAGIAIYDSFGYAFSRIGGAAREALNEAIIIIEDLGTLIFELHSVASQVAIGGIQVGGNASEEAIKAALEIYSAGSIEIDLDLLATAKAAVEGFQKADLGCNETDLLPGMLLSLKSNASTDHPDALTAISTIENDLQLLLNQLTKKPSKDAAKVLAQGIITVINEISEAINMAKQTVQDAGQLASANPQAAITALGTGINAALQKITTGSVSGFLSIGAAGNIAGNLAVGGATNIQFQDGKIGVYTNLALLQKRASIAFKSGGPAIVPGVNAAIQICKAAAQTLHETMVATAQIGFAALRQME